MTTVGQLYNYAFDRESVHYDWEMVDKSLFDGLTNNTSFLNVCLQMIQEQFNMPLQNVWRVSVLPSGMIELNDFTLPSSKSKMRETFKQEDLPVWIQDPLSVLMIVDQGVTVEGVGKKITDSIFYLMETPDLEKIYGNKA